MAQKPKKYFQIQAMMMQVVYGLAPLIAASVYFFGWRALLVSALCLVFGILAEGAFTWRSGKPVTSAVFVTSIIFSLSLPPTIPYWMAVVGIVFGVVFGKMVFGGTGHNVYNPAMAGRCFIYVTFPIAMTNRFADSFSGLPGGLGGWSADAVTTATPLRAIAQGQGTDLTSLFWGNVSGSLGETSVLLIVLGGIWILYKKSANWRLALSYFLGGLAMSAALVVFGVNGPESLLTFFMAGSFLFGCFFIVTEPISGPKTNEGRWIYGFSVGALIIVLRQWSNFPEGVMFAILFGNTFVPILDIAVREVKASNKARAAAKAAAKG